MDKKSLKIPQNPYIEKEQTTQCAKEKVQRDKQRSTKHTHTNYNTWNYYQSLSGHFENYLT
jgi:hypothetical protein